MHRRITTILAGDLAGYSRLIAADEEGVIARLLAARAEVVDPAIDSCEGRIVKTMGDGILVEFGSPIAAVRAALSMQRGMVERQADMREDEQLRFRIGINHGDVVIDGDDVLGDAVNIAARLESLAPVGGLCISRTVYEQTAGQVDAAMTALGPQAVKNLPDPVETWLVEVPGATLAKAINSAERPSIAVLPFDNMSTDPDQGFLADGIVEDVTTELSRFGSLRVIARNSTFAYKGMAVDVRDIAQELGVRYVVEGSVRRAGDRLRITAQLIDAETDVHIWADRWDRTMADLFDLQDELTQAIVTAVEPELGAHERRLARRRPTASLDAWEMCQRGYSEMSTYSDEGLIAAKSLFEAAIAADPNFAIPWAYLARLHFIRITSGRSQDTGADAVAGLACARAALEIDDRIEAGHTSLGVFLAMTGQEDEALKAIRTAIRLNPNNAQCHYGMAAAQHVMKRPDGVEAYQACQAALALSPKDPMVHMFQFVGALGRVRIAMDWTDPLAFAGFRAAAASPKADYFLHYCAALACVAAGDGQAAQRYVHDALARMPNLTVANFWQRFSFADVHQMQAAAQPYEVELIELGMPAG